MRFPLPNLSSRPLRWIPGLALAVLPLAGPRAETPPATDIAVERPYFLRLGYGAVSYRTSREPATVAGFDLPGAGVALGSHGSLTTELGWRFDPFWSLSLLSGTPPTAELEGRGSFAPYGRLSKVTYGSVMLGLQLHPLGQRGGRFDPYIGGGLDYTFILNTSGGAMPELKVTPDFGPILQAGFDFALTDRLSLYADVRKIWLDFAAKGSIATPVGALPVRTSVTPDPLLVSLGLSWRF